MGFNLNHVVINGNVPRDGELKQMQSGTSILNFSVAVNDDYYDKTTQSKKEQSYFFDCSIWGKRAESLARFIVKGQKVAVEGRLVQDKWEDKTTGKNRSAVKITASNVVLFGEPKNGQQQTPQQNYNQQQPQSNAPQTDFNSSFSSNDVLF